MRGPFLQFAQLGIGVLIVGAMAADASAQRPLRAASGCPADTPCLMMEAWAAHKADKPHARREPVKSQSFSSGLVARIEVGSTGQGRLVTFVLRVRGRLGNGPERNHLLSVTGKGALQCSDFQNARLPVLGFTKRAQPIVQTAAGPFALVGKRVKIGCTDCLAVIDKKTLRPNWRLTPFWDRSAATSPPALDRKGRVHYRVGHRCVRVNGRERFQFVRPQHCAPTVETWPQASAAAAARIEKAGRIKLVKERGVPQYLLIDPPERRFYIHLWRAACT